jgi:hypothetical protein
VPLSASLAGPFNGLSRCLRELIYHRHSTYSLPEASPCPTNPFEGQGRCLAEDLNQVILDSQFIPPDIRMSLRLSYLLSSFPHSLTPIAGSFQYHMEKNAFRLTRSFSINTGTRKSKNQFARNSPIDQGELLWSHGIRTKGFFRTRLEPTV